MKGRKQTKMEGGQSGTYLRQTRESSSPWVSVAKTYRDETKLNEYFGQITVAEIFIFVSSLYVLTMFTHGLDNALVCFR